MSCFFQWLTMGLAYVAPIGLQNLCVINSALTQSRHRAFLTALIFFTYYRAGGVEASEYQVSYMTKIRFSQFSECESMKLTEMVFKRHGHLYNVSIFWNFV